MKIRTIFIAMSAALVLATGCSASTGDSAVSGKTLAAQVSTQLEKQVGQKPEKVACPDPLKAKVGATARCTLTDGDTELGVTVTTKSVKDGTVNFNILVDDAPK